MTSAKAEKLMYMTEQLNKKWLGIDFCLVYKTIGRKYDRINLYRLLINSKLVTNELTGGQMDIALNTLLNFTHVINNNDEIIDHNNVTNPIISDVTIE